MTKTTPRSEIRPAPRADLEARWQAITTDVRQFAGEGHYSLVNSPRWEQLDEALTYLASRMIGDVHPDEGSEVDSLVLVLHETIEEQMMTFAATIERARAARRAVAS